MKGVGLLLLFTFLCGACSEPTPLNLKVKHSDLNLYIRDGRWWYNGRVFSGWIQEVQSDQLVTFRMPVEEGLANGLAVGFYENGLKMLERAYVNGKLEGQSRQWWRNGKCKYLLCYKDDKYEGVQRAFFENGHLREEANYVAGKPDGLQRVWDESGQLTSNYMIRNNRVYGIVKVQSCIPGVAH